VWDLHLRGEISAAYHARLLALIPDRLRPRVCFHATVTNAELPDRIVEHDIGLALDVATIPSRNLTITNKVFQYLQGGLALVASDTAGNREVLTQAPEAGVLFPPGDTAMLATALERLCSDPAALARTKTAARNAFERWFTHERQCARYAELVESALRSP
jgi:glycosyltransferase involved in cell wall biosynthesis